MLWFIHHSWLDLILLPPSSCPVYFPQCNLLLIAFLLINSLNSSYFRPLHFTLHSQGLLHHKGLPPTIHSLNSSYFRPFSFFMMQNTTCTWNLGIIDQSFPLTAIQLISQIFFILRSSPCTLYSQFADLWLTAYKCLYQDESFGPSVIKHASLHTTPTFI